jgi:hypothetical protein
LTPSAGKWNTDVQGSIRLLRVSSTGTLSLTKVTPTHDRVSA